MPGIAKAYMFELGASDLHLCVGSPPLVRHDGEIKPLAGWPALSNRDTERILTPIAPPKNLAEFERRHDTDFAYEIPGMARFRAETTASSTA